LKLGRERFNAGKRNKEKEEEEEEADDLLVEVGREGLGLVEQRDAALAADVGGRQRLHLARQEQLALVQLVLLFGRQLLSRRRRRCRRHCRRRRFRLGQRRRRRRRLLGLLRLGLVVLGGRRLVATTRNARVFRNLPLSSVAKLTKDEDGARC